MILITEFMDEDAVASLRGAFDVDYDPSLADRQAEIPARLAGRRALIVRNRTRVTADLLAAAPDLACVGRLGVGLDNIDMDACGAQDVAVYPASGANTLSVAEYVVTTIMLLLRGAYFAQPRMIGGEWPRQGCVGREVAGKCIGLVGYGAIARETARLAGGLGMRAIGCDPYLDADDPVWGDTRPASLEDVLRQADAVSLHTPLTRETRHLIDAGRLALMKADAVLVNAARGGVVDETALVAALKGGRLGGAALDVFETEPLRGEAAARFDGVPNLVLTPHIAGVTEESNVRVSSMIAEKIAAHLRGDP